MTGRLALFCNLRYESPTRKDNSSQWASQGYIGALRNGAALGKPLYALYMGDVKGIVDLPLEVLKEKRKAADARLPLRLPSEMQKQRDTI